MTLPIQFHSSDQKLKAHARKLITRLFSISMKTMSRPVTVHRHLRTKVSRKTVSHTPFQRKKKKTKQFPRRSLQ